MDIKNLLKMTVRLSVPYRSEVVNIEYHCEKITPTYQAQLRRMAEEEKNAEEKKTVEGAADTSPASDTVDAPDAKLLSDLLVGWDITDDGEVYPPTFDNLKVLSFTFLATIARAILSDLVNPTHGSTPQS